MDKESLDKLVGTTVQATVTRSGIPYPITGKLVATRKQFDRIEGQVEFSGTARWFSADKIASAPENVTPLPQPKKKKKKA